MTNVTPGVHNATIIYIDGNNVTSELNTTIAVPKWSTGIDVDVREGLDGTIIAVTSDPVVDGIVLVNVDGKGYYVNMTNGSAELSIAGLSAGNHTAVVTFMGC